MGITAILVLALSTAAPAAVPEFPEHEYIRSLDGCGVLYPKDASAENLDAARKLFGGRHWLGACRHGLADGFGYWVEPSPDSFFILNDTILVLGREQVPRFSIAPSAGVNEMTAGASITYVRREVDLKKFEIVSVPVFWQPEQPLAPIINFDDGSSLDDFSFSHSVVGDPAGGSSLIMNLQSRTCAAAEKKIRGCRPIYSEFDVFGLWMTQSGTSGSSDSFTLCADPKAPGSCEALWRERAGPHLERISRLVQDVRSNYALERQTYAERSLAAEGALPSAWKAHWAANPIDRSSTDLARQCLEITDLHPASRTDAQRIRQKYSAEPCRSSSLAALSIAIADRYVAIDAAGRSQRQRQLEQYAQARAERDAENAAAWGQFFNNVSTMVGAYAAANAPAAPAVVAMPAYTASAPAYQAYGQPAPSVAPSGGAPQTRAIHRPELEATSCVSLVQLAEGDPLSSYGSQVFSNRCGETVEVFWCKVGDECERGSGGTWAVQAGGSWPVPSGQYRWGACRGANSGGLVRESGGQHTGRFACTGP